MNKYIIVIILLSYVLQVFCVSIKPAIEDVSGVDSMTPENVVNSVLYKVVNKYDCSARDVNGE